MKLIESSGSFFTISFPYEEEDVQLMRSLLLSRYFNIEDKVYYVPEHELDEITLKELFRHGFELT